MSVYCIRDQSLPLPICTRKQYHWIQVQYRASRDIMAASILDYWRFMVLQLLEFYCKFCWNSCLVQYDRNLNGIDNSFLRGCTYVQYMQSVHVQPSNQSVFTAVCIAVEQRGKNCTVDHTFRIGIKQIYTTLHTVLGKPPADWIWMKCFLHNIQYYCTVFGSS